LNSLRQNLKYLYFTSIFFLAIGCNGPENLDLTNIGNEVITFNDDVDDEIIFPSMYITSFNNQEIVDDPKIDAELSVLKNKLRQNIILVLKYEEVLRKCFQKNPMDLKLKLRIILMI
jgi:hypothetical protein